MTTDGYPYWHARCLEAEKLLREEVFLSYCYAVPGKSDDQLGESYCDPTDRCWVCRVRAFLGPTRSAETAEAPKCQCDQHEVACGKSADYLVTRAGKRIAVCDRCTLTGDGVDDRDLNPDWSKWRAAPAPPSPPCTVWCGTAQAPWWHTTFCTPACRAAGTPLNPVSRPCTHETVDFISDESGAKATCVDCGADVPVLVTTDE